LQERKRYDKRILKVSYLEGGKMSGFKRIVETIARDLEKRGPKKPLDPSSLFLNRTYAFFEDVASLIKHQELYGFI
jgi:hypothetical protein